MGDPILDALRVIGEEAEKLHLHQKLVTAVGHAATTAAKELGATTPDLVRALAVALPNIVLAHAHEGQELVALRTLRDHLNKLIDRYMEMAVSPGFPARLAQLRESRLRTAPAEGTH